MGRVRLVGQIGIVGLLGLVVLVSLFGLMGWVWLGCQVGLILGIFLLFNLTQKHFQMEILSLIIQKNLMISKSVMV